jgi:hypothetical protein
MCEIANQPGKADSAKALLPRPGARGVAIRGAVQSILPYSLLVMLCFIHVRVAASRAD